MQGPGGQPGRVGDPVTLADIAPTAARLLGAQLKDVDGIDLAPAFAGTALPRESCTPSRSLRSSSSAGRRCDRSGRARGSSSPRRSPSCSTSRRIRASRRTSRRRSRRSCAISGRARPLLAGVAADGRVGERGGRRTPARARLQRRNQQSAISNQQSPGSKGPSRAGRPHRAGHLGGVVRRRARFCPRRDRAGRSAQRSGSCAAGLRAPAGR